MIDLARLEEAVALWEQTFDDLPLDADEAPVFAAARVLLAGTPIQWCEEHGDMSAGLYGFRIDAFSCWAFTQIDWSLHSDATDCVFTDVRLVLLKGDPT